MWCGEQNRKSPSVLDKEYRVFLSAYSFHVLNSKTCAQIGFSIKNKYREEITSWRCQYYIVLVAYTVINLRHLSLPLPLAFSMI